MVCDFRPTWLPCNHDEKMIPLFLALLQLQCVAASSSSQKDGPPIAKPHCMDQCGDVDIPYPFGIGANCSYNASYEINCDYSSHPPKPFLQHFELEVTDINWPGRYSGRDPRRFLGHDTDGQTLTVLTPARNICGSHGSVGFPSVNFQGSPFLFSSWFNVFMVENYCGRSVVLRNRMQKIVAGCASVCANQTGVAKLNTTTCYGVGCCQASLIPSPTHDFFLQHMTPRLDFYEITLSHEALTITSDTCILAAALIKSDQVVNLAGNLSNLRAFPTVLEWDGSLTAVHGCEFPTEGNPYLPNGCQGS